MQQTAATAYINDTLAPAPVSIIGLPYRSRKKYKKERQRELIWNNKKKFMANIRENKKDTIECKWARKEVKTRRKIWQVCGRRRLVNSSSWWLVIVFWRWIWSIKRHDEKCESIFQNYPFLNQIKWQLTQEKWTKLETWTIWRNSILWKMLCSKVLKEK